MRPARQTNVYGDLLVKAERILTRIEHPQPARVLAVVGALTRSLSEYTRTTARSPLSSLTDDGTPYEFSLRFDPEETRFRLLWEAQGSRATANANALWAAGERVHRLAIEHPHVDASALDRIRDLFEPRPGASVCFSMWHALSFDRDGRFLLKLYLNPAAAGRSLNTVTTALGRLGHDGLADLVDGIARRRPSTRVRYFSVDLERPELARTKVYLAHAGVRLPELEDELAAVPGYARGAATALLGGLSDHDGAFADLPILTCLAARPGHAPTLTHHFPVRRYTASDAVVLDKLGRLLPDARRTLLERVLTEDLEMQPDDERRFISYVSASSGASNLTLYLQPNFLHTQARTARSTGT